MTTTSIKVSTELRDRINHDARERGVTAAGLIENLLNDYERRQRMRAVGFAMRQSPPDADYWDEFAGLDAVGGGVSDG